MDELDLLDPELYCCYVHTCFDNSVKYGDHSKDYYEKVILMRMNENVIAEAAGIDCQHCAYFGCTHAAKNTPIFPFTAPTTAVLAHPCAH